MATVASAPVVEVLSSRVLLRPTDLDRSHRFYGETLGLRVYREFGGGRVYFLGGGFLEVSGEVPDPRSGTEPAVDVDKIALWLQVPDLAAVHAHLVERGVDIVEPPARMPWGLDEMWVQDPDGVRIVFVEVPPDHPLRRDRRS